MQQRRNKLFYLGVSICQKCPDSHKEENHFCSNGHILFNLCFYIYVNLTNKIYKNTQTNS